MNNHNPVNLQESPIEIRRSSNLMSRKIVMITLAGLIVVAMVSWLTFLGWGLFEAARAVANLF
jgi:hypothetical protein